MRPLATGPVFPRADAPRRAFRSQFAAPGNPSPAPCPPLCLVSAIRASLAALEPRIDAGPRVSQACVTAPRRQGGLSESEGTVHAALRPAPFRSAEPVRTGRGEGGSRPRPSQPGTRSLRRGTWAPGWLPRAQRGRRAGAGLGLTAREGTRNQLSRVRRRAQLRVPQPGPGPVTPVALGKDGAPATRRGPRPLGGSPGAESTRRPTRDR